MMDLATLYGSPMSASETHDRHSEASPQGAHRLSPSSHEDLASRLRAGAPEALLELAGARLIDADLSGLDLSGACLRGADLSRANLRDATLVGTDFTNATLFKADLTSAELAGAKLEGANLSGATLIRAGFGRANLRGTILVQADLSGSSLVDADLKGADLGLATLADVRATGADWSDANVVDADLRRAHLDRCNVEGTRFDGSDMRDACLLEVRNFRTASWISVDVREINFTGAYLCRSFIHDQNYLAEYRAQGGLSDLIYRMWWLTSDCGRSPLRWSLCTGILVVAFALGYTQVAIDYGSHPTSVSPLYFSVVTMTTLGFGDVLPNSVAGQWLVMVQVVCGYVMLGGLLSLLSNKMATRAD